MAQLDSRLSGLSQERRQLLELLRSERTKPLAPLVRVEGKGELPLSYAQQRLWFIDQLEPGSAVYNVPMAVRVLGVLRIEALERTLREVVNRHEVLRTRIVEREGRAGQEVEAAGRVELEREDLRGLGCEERESEVRRQGDREAERPFDLRQGPLLRARLLELGAGEHVLLLTMHHIVSDGWSMGVLVREIGMLYAAYACGEESPLPELTIQYGDYALWQRNWLQGAELERQVRYWREQLLELPMLELPTDRVRPMVPSHRGGSVSVELPEELTGRLKELAQSQGVTLFMVLLAGFQLMLSRWSGKQDVVVGTDVANRNRAELEQLIGFFVNQLVLRTEVSGELSVGEFLGRVREVCLGAYAHQELPFERLVEELNPERSLGRTPLFQVKLDLQNAPVHALDVSGIRLEAVDLGHLDLLSESDLAVSMVEFDSTLMGRFVYATDLYESSTVERMAGHWLKLLEGMASDAGRKVGELEMLSELERRQVVEEFNRTEEFYSVGTLQELFQRQVEGNPTATALIFGEEELSYEELNGRANQLAWYLQELGVGPEVRVGLCVQRSVEMVVGLLGILKAGGAYVPLDAEYPSERLAYMLEDTQTPLLLTHSALLDRLPEFDGTTVCLDSEWEKIARFSRENPPVRVTGENAVYVIYTSGSTGRPKGVVITHHGLANYCNSIARLYPLDSSMGRRVLQLASLSFDVSIRELGFALCTGSTMVIAREEELLPGTTLGRTLQAYRVTTLIITAPVLRVLPIRDLPELREVVVGGEPCSLETIREWSRGRKLIHVYGLTETTIENAIEQRTAGSPLVPIGRPLGNTRIYVLDERLEPVPIGVAGELYIGGAGVGRGYLHRPELTAERFVPDGFGGGGGRLYRTGDVGRWRGDGVLEFLGRADEQVKVRGYRIEPGEIEEALREQVGVQDAVVVAREDGSGQKRLVGYVVGVGAPSGSELRRRLGERLPEYMVPSVMVKLESLPLTVNGKLDRKALPEPEAVERGEGVGSYVAPRTVTEELLCGIWGRVLGLKRVGVEDNFFRLGGHSLLATQVVSQVRQVFGVELELRRLFETPTASGMAEAIGELQRSGEVDPQPPLVRVEDKGESPLSYAQQRLWFIDQLEPGSAVYNVPVGVRVLGVLRIEALERTLREVVNRHEVLRTRIVEREGRAGQEVEAAGRVELEREDLRGLGCEARESEVRRQGDREAERPFDLRQGPLLRARLLELGAGEHVLLLTMHHIVSDGWSMGVLVREIGMLYAAYACGEESPLPELTIQYGDYALWQRNWLQGAELERQVRYWREQLLELPMLELPTDRVRPMVPSHRGGSVAVELPEELTGRLKELAQSQGVTLFMVLLAGFQLMLSRWSGKQDVVVGTDVANRNRAELEQLIGFFVNQLVLRTEVSEELSVGEFLGRVREVCLGAYAHQELPFERLVEELNPERSLGRTPLFQVKLILQNAPVSTIALPELYLQPVEMGADAAKFDLVLSLQEAGELVVGNLTYAADLYESSTVERMLSHWLKLLEGMASDAGRKVGELEMLSELERRQVVEEFNRTEEFYSVGTLQELFQRQVEGNLAATALIFGEEELSYEELNGRANQLAWYLQELGVGPEVRVGLCVQRSVEMVVGLLGILKAGGAYVPLDAEYPSERLAYMLEDAQTPLLLTHSTLLERLPASWAQIVCLDSEREKIARFSRENPPVRVTGENAVYVIYTSGSTGRPKGVVITHHGLANYCNSIARLYPLDSSVGRRVLQLASLSFDVSIRELGLALCTGSTMVIAREEELLPGTTLGKTLQAYRVTTLIISPPVLRVLPIRDLPELREVVTGGEPCSLETIREWSRGRKLIHGYGLTETTIENAIEQRTAGSPLVPIGRPIGNTRIYVLDGRLEPVPIGVGGELYIGGAGVGRGYLNRPELTAERFVPDGFGGGGGRLYRTGDVGRWRGDGVLEFLGRADEQVKVRGYRIEPGEIEEALREQVGVQDAVVVAREDGSGQKRLVGYVVGVGAPSGSELRRRLGERLPEYMVPSVMVKLESLPLTVNGKLDRKALPEPEAVERGEGAGSYVAPRTVTEELLCGIWGRVLGLERVGVEDNFFDLGGHSLLATQVVSQVRQVFGVELELRRLFETPTASGLAEAIGELQQSGEVDPQPPLVRVAGKGELPLSYAQQRLWFIDQLEPGSAVYNVPVAVRVLGVLRIEALERTLREVVNRHEVLRTRIVEREGRAGQEVEAAGRVELEREDLRGLGCEARESEVRRQGDREAERPFDLRQGPLLRARLLELGAGEHVLLLTMHHIVSDGWSMGVLVREIGMLYAAYACGEESPLPELTIQYGDYALWQRNWLQGAELERQVRYWREQLLELPMLELPTDRVRPMVPSHRGGSVSVELPEELTGRLKELAQSQGVTLFMVLLAGFQLMLSRWSGKQDVVVGTDVANRNRAELEQLIGFFVNQLVLRTEVSGELSVGEFLGRVREVCLGAYAHQELPFERLVEELNPERSLGRTPLFQVKLILQNAPVSTIALPELYLQPVEMGADAAKFDLVLSLQEAGELVVGNLTYAADLYESSTAERMLSHWLKLLEGMASDAGRKVGELEMLSELERRQVVEEFNRTEEFYIVGTLQELFQRQVEGNLAATALIFGEEELSYEELNGRANQLAWYLQELGVGPEVRVGLCVQRSVEMVVGLLGILKAGGAYVPLDAEYPSERLAYMLEDAQTPLLLTHSTLLERLPASWAQIVCLDSEREKIARFSRENPPVRVTGENAVYVIYTSGSTGRPKGVVITHHGLANLAQAQIQGFALKNKSRVLQFASISFDAAVSEWATALLGGATLIVTKPEVALVGRALEASLIENQISVVTLPPSVLLSLADVSLSGLETLVVAGEACPSSLVKRLGYQKQMVNAYGPSEITVCASTMELSKEALESGVVPIGRPIGNTRIYVLDERLEPVPIGVGGELYIGGAGVGRGYLNRPELTAERFVPDGFGGGGGRLYRTGDVGRWRGDGVLEFLGRADEQVKVRGYRIEPGEIEEVLREQVGVQDAVVVAREDGSGQKRLVGYVVGGGAPSGSELRRRLGERLPEYMVPSVMVKLESLPLTVNGKLDRKALPEPEAVERGEGAGTYVAPRDRIELILTRIWQSCLGLHTVGIRDSFFHVGGNSLSAVFFVNSVRSQLGFDIPLSAVFQTPTIEALASRIRERAGTDFSEEAPILPLIPRASHHADAAPFFFVHPLGGMALCYRELATIIGTQHPFYGLQNPAIDFGSNPTYWIAPSIERMATQYIRAIKAVEPGGPYHLGGMSFGGILAFEIAQQLQRNEGSVASLALLDARLPNMPTSCLSGEHSTTTNKEVAYGHDFDDADWLADTFFEKSNITDSSFPLATSPDEKLNSLLLLAKSQGIIPVEADLAWARQIASVIRAHLTAESSYHPSTYSGRIVLFTSDEQIGPTSADYGIGALTSHPLEIKKVPGSHRTMVSGAGALAIAKSYGILNL